MDNICKWAHERISTQDFVLLDCAEHRDSQHGEIIDLAMLNSGGATIFDSLIKPVGRVTEAAKCVHHISDEMLERAPSFADIWPQIWGLLAGKIVITYNVKFDFGIMALSLLAHGLPTEQLEESESRWHCLMELYKQHIHMGRWQKLDIALQQQKLSASNTHRALADAKAAYSLLKHLAGKYPGSQYKARQVEHEIGATTQSLTTPVALLQEPEMERAQKPVNYIREEEAQG